MPRNWRFIVFSLLATSCAVAIFVISSMPRVPMPPGYYDVPNADKLLHTLEYLVFGLLLCFAFHSASNPKVSERALVLALVVGLVYGITDEVHQAFVPGRTASLIDVAFNSLGVGIALVAFRAWGWWRSRKGEPEEGGQEIESQQ